MICCLEPALTFMSPYVLSSMISFGCLPLTYPILKYSLTILFVCMFSTADLEIRNAPFPKDYALGIFKIPIWGFFGFRLKT